jgi:hypothetical protein
LLILSPQLTAAAGDYAYAYVNLRLLGEIDVAVAPGGRQHRPFFSTFYLFFFTFLYWGHWRLWTWLLNSYSSPPESPMDGLPTFRLTCVPAYLRSGLPTFRLTYVPAYLRSGLPTFRLTYTSTASQPTWLIVFTIITVHHQFKRNIYLSLYVILYVSLFLEIIFFIFFF